MSDLQRWSLGWNKEGVYQRHDSDGHWVEHEQATAIIEQQQAEINALKAYVERLRDFADKVENWNECTADFRVNFGAKGERDYYRNLASEALAATPQANLNHVKRSVFADGYYKGFSDAWGSNHDWQQDHINYGLERSEIVAEQEYPSVKDGE